MNGTEERFRASLLALGDDLAARVPASTDRALIEHRATAVLRRRQLGGAAALSAVTIAAVLLGGPTGTDSLQPAPVATPDQLPNKRLAGPSATPLPPLPAAPLDLVPGSGPPVTPAAAPSPAGPTPEPSPAAAAPSASGSTTTPGTPGQPQEPSAVDDAGPARNGPARPDLRRLRVYRDGDVLRVQGPVADRDGVIMNVTISWTGGTGGAYAGMEGIDPTDCQTGQARTIDEFHEVDDLVTTEVVTITVQSVGCDEKDPQETQQRYVVP